VDLVQNQKAQAQALRKTARINENENQVTGFLYRVEGTDVYRYGPHGSSLVTSMTEIEESLTSYQLNLFWQNRRAAIRLVV
jgi:hypothetical protein